jgi:hypothetical protein
MVGHRAGKALPLLPGGQFMPHLAERLISGALVALVLGGAGCSALHSGPSLCSLTRTLAPEVTANAVAQRYLAEADALQEAGDAGCVDRYFAACSWAWQTLREDASGTSHVISSDCYNAALEKLLCSAQWFKRLDPARGLVIHLGAQSVVIPVVHHATPWAAADFQRLRPPLTGRQSSLMRRYCSQGIGAPLVVDRARNPCDAMEERFLPEKSYFGATAVLRFQPSASPDAVTTAVLDFYNPLAATTVCDEGLELPLASDLSAPLAQVLEDAPRSYLAGFIEPGGTATAAKLAFLEPYQRGKAPVVLIHGLFSDPQSWADLINDLRAAPGFTQRYQLWVFRYPTGQGFLQSAAVLRRELQAAIAGLDPACRDSALRQIVLIGHSMGGLVAKLQVAHSEELVWSRLANRPLEEIVTTPSTRAFLAEACYFDPLAEVCRVIFIASPHHGSLCSSSMFGRCAALLVEPSSEQTQMHEQLIRDNPGTFNPVVERRFPTSIDMLVPSSPLLDAMQQMKLRQGLKLHNIIGVSHPLSLDGPSDGVVSVHSASHPGCQSVLAINAPHVRAHRDLATSREILRILGCY